MNTRKTHPLQASCKIHLSLLSAWISAGSNLALWPGAARERNPRPNTRERGREKIEPRRNLLATGSDLSHYFSVTHWPIYQTKKFCYLRNSIKTMGSISVALSRAVSVEERRLVSRTAAGNRASPNCWVFRLFSLDSPVWPHQKAILCKIFYFHLLV